MTGARRSVPGPDASRIGSDASRIGSDSPVGGTAPTCRPLSTSARRRLGRLRPDGPDEMGRELAEGPAAVAATLEAIRSERHGADEILAAAERIVLLGTGASLAMARAAVPAWRAAEQAGTRRGATGAGTGADRRPRAVLVRESTEAVFGGVDGDTFRRGDAVIAISQSGISPETLAAARLAARSGATLVAITAHARSPLAAAARATVALPIGEEHGAATKSELATLAALLTLGGGLPDGPTVGAWLAERLAGIVRSWEAVLPSVPCLVGAPRTWIVGLGATAGLAHAGALLWHEKAHRQAVGGTVSEFRHGLVESVGTRDAVLLLVPWPCTPDLSGYLDLLAREVSALGAALVRLQNGGVTFGGGFGMGGGRPVDAAGRSAVLRGTRAGLAPGSRPGTAEAEMPATDLAMTATAADLLGQTLRLQQLARGTAHACGRYVDGFRVLRHVVLAAPSRFD